MNFIETFLLALLFLSWFVVLVFLLMGVITISLWFLPVFIVVGALGLAGLVVV